MDISALRSTLLETGQEHVLQHWDELTASEQQAFHKDLTSINCKELNGFFSKCKVAMSKAGEKLDAGMEPLPEEYVGSYIRSDAATLAEYEMEGLRAVSENKVGVLLLAGGQGTRLGVPYPKGMYNVGLPSQKTLYQLQAERILKLQQLAKQRVGKSGVIPWYIMTSEHTMQSTRKFFADHNYFGLQAENVVLFEQNMLPCVTFDGKIILEKKNKVARAPDGNGGLYKALVTSGVLSNLEERNVEYLHVYCVDNILVKMADPVFMGFCIKKNAPCGAKVVEKVVPTEGVGVLCKADGVYQVIEYSEITLETAERRNSDGRLTFSAGNICNHFFTRQFLHTVSHSRENELDHHVAKKKITYCTETGDIIKPSEPNGVKMEKFVFDVFKFASDSELAVWEVVREDEFSPLKNADGAAKDTPTTSRASLSSLHRRFIENAGGEVVEHTGQSNGSAVNGVNSECSSDVLCEVSPLVSYAGEGLSNLVEGKKLQAPVLMYSPEETHQSVLKSL